jgi:exonuclease VII large subunit
MRPELLAEAIAKAEGDIVAIVRGGLEGMAAFDDKNVEAALAKKRAYRFLGIGHRITSSLLDLVPEYTADVPSDAGAHIVTMAESMSRHTRKLEETKRQLDQARQIAKQPAVPTEVTREVVPKWAYAMIAALTVLGIFLVFVELLHRGQ